MASFLMGVMSVTVGAGMMYYHKVLVNNGFGQVGFCA